MKKSQLKQIIKEEISRVLKEIENPHDPWTGQGEMFGASEQFDMAEPQAEAYNAWKTALNKKYGNAVQLYPSKKHQGRKGPLPFVTFDLKGPKSSTWSYITIDDDGTVSLPIGFYRRNYEEQPDWMNRDNSPTLRPITMNDVPEIVAGLER